MLTDRHAWHWNGPKITTPIWFARPRLPGSILHSYWWPFCHTHLNNTGAANPHKCTDLWFSVKGSVDSSRSWFADARHSNSTEGSVRSWRINMFRLSWAFILLIWITLIPQGSDSIFLNCRDVLFLQSILPNVTNHPSRNACIITQSKFWRSGQVLT